MTRARADRPTQRLATAITIAVAFACAVRAPSAQQPKKPPSTKTEHRFATDAELNVETREAVNRALDWLARSANRDGSFGEPKARIAVTSIAALSFMAGGSTANRGPYRREVSRAVRYLMNHVSTHPDRRGYIAIPEDNESRMHGHGFATLALVEALGTYGQGDAGKFKQLKDAVISAIRLIERTQSEAGGWYYHPVADGNHEGSITVCMLQALRAANNAGIYVKKHVVERAIHYIKESAEKRDGVLTGRYKYSLTESQTSYALTAAAVSTLHMCGIYDSDYVRLGLQHMEKEVDDHLSQGAFYYYGLLYASQAYFQVGGSTWRKYFPKIRDSILDNRVSKIQDPPNAGAFAPHHPSQEGEYSLVYATAMATLTLQIPYRFLPIFQK